MSDEFETYDLSGFLAQQPSVRSSASSASTGFPSRDSGSTPATSPPISERKLSVRSASDVTTTIPLDGPLILTFVKGSKLFKLKYTQIDICREAAGALRCVELSDPAALSGTFIHAFPRNKKPIPHLEKPATSRDKSLRVSFLEEQTVQVAQTIFNTQPQYNFETINDCERFQQEVLGMTVLFVAGVAEISSKGRGEEAISQNLRLCRTVTGSTRILFFANSQRKDRKKYVILSVESIEKVEQPKKSGKPVHLKLDSSDEFTASMKDLSILFIDSEYSASFLAHLQGAGVRVTTK